jgi:hypothetical protein
MCATGVNTALQCSCAYVDPEHKQSCFVCLFAWYIEDIQIYKHLSSWLAFQFVEAEWHQSEASIHLKKRSIQHDTF